MKNGKIILLSFFLLLFFAPVIAYGSSLETITLSKQNYNQLENNLIELREINETLSSNLNLSLEELIELQQRQNQLVLELRTLKTELQATKEKLIEVESSLTTALESLEIAEEKAKKLRDKPNNINVAVLAGKNQGYIGVRYISKNFGAGAYKRVYGDEGSLYFIEGNYTFIRW